MFRPAHAAVNEIRALVGGRRPGFATYDFIAATIQAARGGRLEAFSRDPQAFLRNLIENVRRAGGKLVIRTDGG
jgi:hypothetical protein